MDTEIEVERPILSGSAIEVKNAYKSYSVKKEVFPILKGLCMNVSDASIYSLLGASGCGKTTLLSCILNLKQLESGQINVYGNPTGSKNSGVPGKRVGYMPQELALYSFFTMREILHLFGNIHGMTTKEIEERRAFLMELLNLPTKDRFIYKLSGGQQRRVSCAVALLHNPQLLLLDEPTVGVDSVLRDSIWRYLKTLVAEGKTILITTHYIDEAKNSDRVGLMYDGQLLQEEKPETLLMQFNCPSLEDVFLKVCVKQNNMMNSNTADVNQPVCTETKAKPVPNNNKRNFIRKMLFTKDYKTPKKRSFACDQQSGQKLVCFRGLRGILWKNYISITRGTVEMLFYLFIPLGLVCMVSIATGEPPRDLPLAIVNNEYPDDPLCDPHDRCAVSDYSCNLLDALDKNMVKLVPYPNEDAAIHGVERGEVWGILEIPGNYSDHVQSRLFKGMKADEDNIAGSRISVRLDMANHQISFYLQYMLIKSMEKFVKDRMNICRLPSDAVDIPIVLKDPVYGQMTPSFRDFVLPAVLTVTICCLVILYSASSYIKEKHNGLLDRLWVSGLSTTTMFVGSIMMQYMLMVVLFVSSSALAVWAFGVVVKGSVFWMLIMFLLEGTCAIGIGNMFSLVMDEESLAMEMIIGLCVTFLLLCGVVWPLESVTPVFRFMFELLPFTLSIESFRHMLSRGWEPWHPRVWPGFLCVTVWTVIVFGVVFYMSSRQKGKSK